MAENVVKNTIVLKEKVPDIGAIQLTFENKTIALSEYLKMMVDLSQCGIHSSLILTFTTKE